MINWKKFPDEKPSKMGKYLVWSSDDYMPGMMIKTRVWGGYGWEYGDNYITHWAEYPNTPDLPEATEVVKMKEFDITFDWDDPEGTDQVFEVRAVGRYRPPVGAPRATNERTFLTAPEPGEMEIDYVTIDGLLPGLDPEKFEGLVWQELGY